jgi:hypothetical protein
MQSFSQRKGLIPVSEVIQVESMNDSLRNSLWNVLDNHAWGTDNFVWAKRYGEIVKMEDFSRRMWANYFKLPIDTRPKDNFARLKFIRERFFEGTWNEVYDLLEYLIQPEVLRSRFLSTALNSVLEREGSGYRIVGNLFVDIVSEQEVAMLDAALRDTKFAGVTVHLRRALELLADRDNPDYRNSIKESISAIESMAKIVSGQPKATLGEALRVLERDGQMHKALKEGFLKLYGYTNDEDGIRHAMLEEPTLTAADAKYFLMSCTSFANYIKAQLPQ